MVRLLSDAARLNGRERTLAVRAVAWLLLSRLAISLLPFRTVRRGLHGIPSRQRARASAIDCERAIRRASRVLPSSRCLALACAGAALLRREGRESQLTLHVNHAGDRLEAHASLVADGVIVSGSGDGMSWPVLFSDRIQP
jgi:hypothetical protein